MKTRLGSALLVAVLCSACSSSASEAPAATAAQVAPGTPSTTPSAQSGTAPPAALQQLLLGQADVPAGSLLADGPEADAQSTEPTSPAPTDCSARFRAVGERQPGQVDQAQREFSAPKDGDAPPSGFVHIVTSYSSAEGAAATLASLESLVRDCASVSYDVDEDHHDLALRAVPVASGGSGFAFDVDETITQAGDDSSTKFTELRESRAITVSNGPMVSQVIGSRVVGGDVTLLERVSAVAAQRLASAG